MEYSAGLMSHMYWLAETRTTAEYVVQGFNKDAIRNLAVNENIYQMKNISRANRNFMTIYNRIENMPESLVQMIAFADISITKLLVLISMMRTDRLFFEFMYEVYRGNITGIGNMREAKEAADTSFRYLKTNSKTISGSIFINDKDFMLHVQDLNGVGMTSALSLASLIALCSAALDRPPLSSLAILGQLSIGGTITKVEELANVLQVSLDSGANKVLLPITAATDLGTVPPELMGNFNIIFY